MADGFDERQQERVEIANEVFATCVANKRNITGEFFAGFGWDPAKAQARFASDREVRRRNRELMAGRNGGIRWLQELAKPCLKDAEKLLAEGRIGAVDGTDAISTIDFMTYSQYACATGWVTRRVRGDSTVVITETSATHVDPDEARDAARETMQKLAAETDQGRNSASWPTTFRENEERLTALDRCEADIVLLDGPIVTQNLLTQKIGRETLQRLFDHPFKIFIGIIKDITGSMSDTKWSALALEPGEAWLVGSIQPHIKERYSAGETLDWATRTLPEDYVRLVFRPSRKPFAIECRERDIPLAASILVADASPTINHELPLLLEMIDAQLRAGFAGSAIRNLLYDRMMSIAGYGETIAIMPERKFR